MFKVGDIVRSTSNTHYEWKVLATKLNPSSGRVLLLQPVAEMIKGNWEKYQTTNASWSTLDTLYPAPLDRQKVRYKRNLPAWW